ncbi:hypothetical protein HYV70_05285 [Candidatus Uhrbacteria bacterium]|nr:hypothetical protein [Candidatus Uhrbacteria bacterium]
MERYRNLNGNSDVEAYEIQSDAIIVKFSEANKDGYRYYKYGNFKPGSYHLQQLKQLALLGRGLGGYISSNVRKNYEDRYRQYE